MSQFSGNITAVFTHKWLGDEMGKLVDTGNDVTVSLSEGRHSKLIPNINRSVDYKENQMVKEKLTQTREPKEAF